jgi:NADPH-dependent ferric siderophore reductase
MNDLALAKAHVLDISVLSIYLTTYESYPMNEINRPAAFQRRPLSRWPLTVVGAVNITPRMRRVSLVGEELEGFDYRPGQDLLLNLPDDNGGVARRHYTIRRFDALEGRLEIDFALHGAWPATNWARRAALGDTITAEGPRGRTSVRGVADWRLFTGDETALPGIAAMIERLPASEHAIAFIEVAGAEEEQPIETAAKLDLTWLHRDGPPRAPSLGLMQALTTFQLPSGVGQACIIGETSTVRAQRQGLLARGFPKDQIAAEGYWRPGRVGGHDHIVEPTEFITALARGGRGPRG